MYLVDKAGDIKEIQLDVKVHDIAIHPFTDVFYSVCNIDKSIRTVDIRTGTTTIVFTTADNPCCITFTADRTILVGFLTYNKVVNYTLRGEILESVTAEQPWQLSVCGITGNIVIAALGSGIHVMNKDFQTMFVYNGPTEERQSKKSLSCYDAVFDTEGHILVGDIHNMEVHVVNAVVGKHLKTINSDTFGGIRSLCLHQDDGLVVGTSKPNKLVFLKYI